MSSRVRRIKQKAKTKYCLGGDDHLAVYYSEESDLIVQMMTLAYRRAILEAEITGVTEVSNGECSLMVHFDPMRIRCKDLIKELKEIEKELTEPEKWVYESRLFEIPIWFDDPWAMECYLAHKERYPLKDGSMSNLAYCARNLGLSIEKFIQKLTAPQYLVFALAFAIGLHGLAPLVEKQDLIQLPKYESSRPWSPPRVLCGGGITYSIHPYVLPGGFSMLGNTPVPMTSFGPTEEIVPALKDKLTLANLGDRFILRSIGKEEYEEIRSKVKDGTYEYKVTYQKWKTNNWIEAPGRYMGTNLP